jgi:F-type H+-transporting ATPase subunit b
VSINWWTFLFQTLNFVVLAYVLHRLLYKPLHEAIVLRQQAGARAQAEAVKAREQAEAVQKQLEIRLAETEQQRQEVLSEARAQAEAEGRKLLTAAETTINQRRDEAAEALRRQRDEALRLLRSEVVGQAVALSRRLLAEAADRTLHRQLTLHLAETLRHLPDKERDRVRAQWRPEDGVTLETAEETDGDTLARVNEAVATVIGNHVTLAVQSRPDLLGGVRLCLGGQVWDSSLAGQLEGVSQAGSQENAP